MSTKLRSACDKCHETKVRCSGDVPCQGCLTSRSLCFYSVSNPLGRPRGTKKKQIRGGSRGNNTWDRDDVANGDAMATTAGTSGDRGSSKRTRTNNGDCSGSVSRSIVVSNGHRDDASNLLGSGGPPPSDNSSFIPTHHGQHNVCMSDATAPSGFRLNSPLNPAGSTTKGLGDVLPHSFDYNDLDRYAISDVARSDFSSLSNLDARTPILWDDSTFSVDSETSSELLRTGAENLDFSDTFKGYQATQNAISDDVLPNANPQPQSHASSESSLSVSVPTGSEDVTMANKSTPMRPTESASPKALSANTCTCLQKHAEVLSNPILSENRACDGPENGAWSMDKALSLANQAMKAWQGLLTCLYCPYDDDQEVMLLTFMSIRAVTRYLQRLSPRYTNISLQVPGSNSPQSAKGDDRLRIGSFELEGSDRMLVLRVLYQATLQKVKCILHSLQVIQNKKKGRLLEKTQNKPAGADDYQASSNLFHIQQISYGLVTSLHALESALNGSKDSGAMDLLGNLQATKNV
ncbi:hypothetical protein B0O99DRAFT_667881 [Bisporella sp. PMI_857]|nr:hypothetical protein B0O99DRAFT_667881 [Bisporella sp. PMI_857]